MRLYGAMAAAGVPRECPEGWAKGYLRTFHSFRYGYAKAALEAGASIHWLSRRVIHTPVEGPKTRALRGFLSWAVQGSNLRPWD